MKISPSERCGAGHSAQIGGFEIRRSRILPPDSLLTSIWLDLNQRADKFGPGPEQISDLTAAGFTSLLFYLREGYSGRLGAVDAPVSGVRSMEPSGISTRRPRAVRAPGSGIDRGVRAAEPVGCSNPGFAGPYRLP